MSIVSRWTIGAIASKKARSASPVTARIASARAGEVSGPVAMITASQSAGGRPAISSRTMLDQRVGGKRRGDMLCEAVAIDGERAARRHFMRIGGGEDQRVRAGAFRGGGCRWRSSADHRRGRNSSRRVRRNRRSDAPASFATGAFRAARPAARAGRSARQLPSPPVPPPMIWIGFTAADRRRSWRGREWPCDPPPLRASAECLRPLRRRGSALRSSTG